MATAAGRLDRGDVPATAQFLALVAPLPLLPDRGLAMLGVSPRRVWSVVALVAALSYLGHLLSRVLDPTTAVGVAGALGGSASPGATVVWLASRTRREPAAADRHAVGAAVAATTLFARNIAVVGVVAPSLARSLAVPFLAMAAVGAAVTAALWARARTDPGTADGRAMPFRARPALAVGAAVAVALGLAGALDVSVPETATRTGVVLGTAAELAVYAAVARATGARTMARALAAILLGAGGLGVALVVLA